MSTDNEKSAVEALRERQLTDASSLEINEPEVENFSLETVFEEPEVKETKRTLFGKRKEKEAVEIKIKNDLGIQPAKTPVVEVDRHFEENDIEEEDKVITEEDVAPALLEVQPDILDSLDQGEAIDVEIPMEEEEDVKFIEDEPDVFYERKKFLASQYEKAEAYLESHSKNGYHFAKKKGNKFYFKEGEPKNYYYQYCYFKFDPEKDEWVQWEKDGWTLVGRATGKNNMEAGWYIFRNELPIGEYKKEIDNDMEKFKLFRRLNSSYRSTIFLFFIIMCICAVTAYLQYKFHGFLATLIACGVIFFLSFVFFVTYIRYLINSKRAFSKLKTKLRLKEKEAFIQSQNVPDYSQTEEELNSDWNEMEEKNKIEQEEQKEE